MALAFERRPELRRTKIRPRVMLFYLERWFAHCAITGAFGFIVGALLFL